MKYHDDKSKIKSSFLNYHLLDKITKIGHKIIGDPFQIEDQFTLLEKKVFLGEFKKTVTPISYFKQVGEGYGFFFYYGALGATHSLQQARVLRQFGSNLGTIVALRDASAP